MRLKWIILPLTLFIIIGLTTTGIIASVKWWFLETLSHDKSGTCQIIACTISTSICDDSICEVISVNYTLLNGTALTSYQSQFVTTYEYPDTAPCPNLNSTLPCHYDNRNITKSLSLDELSSTTLAIWAIIILSLVLFVAVMACLVVMSCGIISYLEVEEKPQANIG